MNGFFTRLAQRTLGSAQAVRPFVAPRFSQAPIAEDFSATEEIRTRHDVHTEVENKNDKPNLQKATTEPAHKNRQASPLSGQHARQPRQNERHVQIVKPATIETKDRINKFKSVEDDQKDIEVPKVPVETKTHIAPGDRTNQTEQTGIEHQYFTNGEALVDTLLVSVLTDRTQEKEGARAHSEDFNHPMDIPLNHGIDASRSADVDRMEKQKSNESQAINITIGRVEVRAVHPTPVPIKPNRATSKPLLSLDDYLQQRRKGER